MLEFKTIEEHKAYPKLLELIKKYTYKTKKGKVKVLLKTNLQFIEPTEYLITYPATLTILEYKVNEISNKPFHINEYKEKYNLTEIDDDQVNRIINDNIELLIIVKNRFRYFGYDYDGQEVSKEIENFNLIK